VIGVLRQLGDPQRDLDCVHVAGTNGKGSVCAMIESVARAAGLRTGLYTSPHLCRFNERIRLGGSPIDDERFARCLRLALDPKLPELTFFETMTVAGLCAMREAEVDLAVIEVGLGGRLDATNVLESPLCTAIVTIGLDHTEYLGDSIASVAREKAGILKRGRPVVLGSLEPEALGPILAMADDIGAQPIWRVLAGKPADTAASAAPLPGPRPADRRIWAEHDEAGQVRIQGEGGQQAHARLRVAGPHQAHNAAVAAGVVWQIAERFAGLERALAPGLGAAEWPGRLETIVVGDVRVLLDCAHNPAGAMALHHAVSGTLDPARTTLLFGAMSDKQWQPMLALLAPLAQRRMYTEPLRPIAGRHCASPSELAAVAPGLGIEDPAHALEAALGQARAGDTLLVTGSIFLVGAVRAVLLGLKQDVILPA